MKALEVIYMLMQFKSALPDPNSGEVAIFLYEGDDALEKRPDLEAFKPQVAPLLKDGQIKASFLGELSLKTTNGWLLLIGLGPEDKISPAKITEAVARAIKMALARKMTKLDLALPPVPNFKAEQVLELAAVAAGMARYQQTEFKSGPEKKESLASVRFLSPGLKKAADVLKKAQIISEAVCLTRRLGDCPGNILFPESFVKEAQALAKPLKLKVTVLDEKALAKEKMNLILAVGGGSARPPRLLTIEYKGGAAKEQPVVLVGKGVTFDSGGMSLKPAANLLNMKTDMAGAAAVLATILAAAKLELPLNLTAVMPLAENMPDGAGARVDDVYTSRSGQTVEITNTDAEGRLILAEALTWAGEMKPRAVIDVATLTGACAVALGDRCAGLFSSDPELQQDLLNSAKAVGELLWPLPLLDEYDPNLKSETADMVNAPGVPIGGAIHAALFLRKFAPTAAPWAHLDVAGAARTSKARPGFPVGTAGFAVRTLLNYVIEQVGRS